MHSFMLGENPSMNITEALLVVARRLLCKPHQFGSDVADLHVP